MMSVFQRIKPALILFVLMALVTGMLITAHDLTYVDETGVMTEKLTTAVTKIYGEGDYRIVTDWTEVGYHEEVPKGVINLITDEKGNYAFHMIQDAYNKEGLELVVGVKDGVTQGIAFIAINDTPGIGVKVGNESFYSKLQGKGKLSIAKRPQDDTQIEAVAGATYSSKGVVKAVNLAIDLEEKLGGGERE